jgi:hypothetical protein
VVWLWTNQEQQLLLLLLVWSLAFARLDHAGKYMVCGVLVDASIDQFVQIINRISQSQLAIYVLVLLTTV